MAASSSVRGASEAHGPHHIVLSCRWTPHGPCWGSGETPACSAKLSLHPDIKNRTLGSAHCHFKIHEKEMPRGCVRVNVKVSKRDADVSYISKTKCQTQSCKAGPRGPEGCVREGFDEFCERSTDSSLTGTFGKRMGHMQMACTVWRRSFPQAECEKGSPSPCRAR